MGQAPTVELPTRLPLVVDPTNRADSTSTDSRLVNCYIEHHGEETWVFKRPGLATSTQPSGGAGTGRGIYNWLGNTYSIVGSTLYKDTTSKGTVNATAGVYRWSSCLGSTPKLVFGDGVKAYTYDDSNGLVLISDAQFPAAFVKGWAFVDGATYVMTAANGAIYNSGTNDPQSWTGDNIQAQIEPDRGMALAKQLVYVVALKQWSTEIFFDAGNATGSPLGQVAGAKLNYGCTSAESVQDLEGVLIWCSQTRSAGLQFVAMENLKLTVISTRAIERLLQTMNLTTIFSWQLRINGHRWYCFTCKESNISIVYDLEEKLWWQITDASGNYFPFVSATYNANWQHLLQHETDGYIYRMDGSYVTDNGSVITWDIYTPNFDGGVRRRKMLARLELIGDQTPGNLVRVRFNDHDYDAAKWTNFRTLDMGKQRPFITDCGTFYRRVFNFRGQSSTRSRIQAVELQMDLGTL